MPLFVAARVALTVGTPLAASAEGGGANNVVTATTTGDGSSLARSGLQVTQVGGPTVLSSNIAEATAYACTGCRSVAIAMQAVMVTGDPSTASPRNAAVATTNGCESCTSYAFAYQYVFSVSGPVYLDPPAQADLAALRAEMADVAASGLSPDEMTARLDALEAQFKATIDGALHPVNGLATTSIDVVPAS